MRHLAIVICCVVALIVPAMGYAGSKDEYDQACKLYVAAGACMAAYNDRYGTLANYYLEHMMAGKLTAIAR